MRPTTPNILATYALASSEELDNGAQWYPRAHALACELDGGDGRVGAGVLAALSPITPWSRNAVLGRRAFALGRLDGGTLSGSVRKANAILDGADPLDVLGGLKVRNFFEAIANPLSPDAVVIDRHAFDVAVGKVCVDADRGQLGRLGDYARFARAYARAGAILGTTPATVQATTWVTWRRLKGLAD